MQAIATPMTQDMKEWTKVFPKSMTENYTSSVTFMKQITTVAVSTITYMKNFPDDSYTFEYFGGLKLLILKKKCRDEFADFVSTALTQAFEAFDKKYLHQLALCFYKDEFTADNLLEYYIFEYSYNKDGVSMSVHSKGPGSSEQTSKFSFENVRDRTVHLIRAYTVVPQTSHNNIEYCHVSVRLYYNDDAPEGYNVTGFTAASPDDDHIGQNQERAVKLGFVETPYHKLAGGFYVRNSPDASNEAIPSQNAPIMTQDAFDEGEPQESVWEESRVRCPCNKQDEDEQMLTCFYCNKLQHAVCFGLSLVSEPAPAHCCERCHELAPGRAITDLRLLELPKKQKESLCILRRALQQLTLVRAISCAGLARALRVSAPNADKLMRMLSKQGIVQDGSDASAPKKILPDELNAAIDKYFQNPENNIVDRLLAETFASQENIPDPVGDVLKPLEKVSLQNADTLGRVIDNVPPPPAREDSTLLQYKEAVFSNYQNDENLPLSGSHNPVQDMENIGKKLGKRKMTDENAKPKGRRSASLKTKRAKTKA